MKREVVNKILLLKLIMLSERVNEQKLNHLVFILQKEGRKERKKTFNYEFIKWNIEPYCSELEKDIEHLLFEELIARDNGLIVTKSGKKALKQYSELFVKNKIDSFFKFFLYLYLDHPLYKLADFVFKKYEIGKYQSKEEISTIIHQEVERGKIKMDEERKRINSKYRELEKNEEKFIKRIHSLMESMEDENEQEEKSN